MKKKASRGKGRPVKNEIGPIDATPEEIAKAIFAAADSRLKKPRIFANQAPVKKKDKS